MPEQRAPEPLPALSVTILPDDKGVESVARQIRMTGRAYPLFQIAMLFLQKPERQQILFEIIKNAEGQPTQPLFHCALDDTLWLSEDEAIQHILNRHFATFYQAEKTPTDPPKGIYTFVAQCGMSGAVLGPPNYHDYQNQLRRLHSERFSRLPFEVFKARVKMVKDPEVVKKWIEDHSVKTEYLCLNVAETQKLSSREEVEKHFRSVHLANLVKPVESFTMPGAAAKLQRCPALQRLLRAASDDQRHFPLKLATILSQKFAGHGLQFFKVNRTVTHVSVARPHYLDMEATPVSEGVRKIVQFIQAHPKTTRRRLVENLAPSPKPAEVKPAPQPETAPEPATASASPETSESAPAAAPAAAPAPAAEPAATPEQTALAADLHWLIHQGHVIEFANGILETAKKPLPKPPKPAAPEKAQASATTASTEPAAAQTAEAEVTLREAPAEAMESHGESQAEGAQSAPASEEHAAAASTESTPAAAPAPEESKPAVENASSPANAPASSPDQPNVLAS
jgi:hypothetical protein